jgi:hypothetical protein
MSNCDSVRSECKRFKLLKINNLYKFTIAKKDQIGAYLELVENNYPNVPFDFSLIHNSGKI